MAFFGLPQQLTELGPYTLGDTLFVDLRPVHPETGASHRADTLPLYRVYTQGQASIVCEGILAETDSTLPARDCLPVAYRATVPLTQENGFTASGAYVIRLWAFVAGFQGATFYSFHIVE